MTWLALFFVWLPVNVLAYLLAPVLPLFASDQFGMSDNNHYRRVEPRLPMWLGWFMTPDNSLLGDAAFLTINGSSYWSMVKWLWRNPAAGLDAGTLAAHIKPSDLIEVDGNPKVSDAPHGFEGRCFVQIGRYWNLVKVTRLTWPFNNYCEKINLGWELKTYAEDLTRLKTQPVARFAASIRPTKFVTQ